MENEYDREDGSNAAGSSATYDPIMTHSGDNAYGWYLVPVPPMTIIQVETAEEARNAPTGHRVILEMPWHVAEELGHCGDDTCDETIAWEEALRDADAPTLDGVLWPRRAGSTFALTS